MTPHWGRKLIPRRVLGQQHYLQNSDREFTDGQMTGCQSGRRPRRKASPPARQFAAVVCRGCAVTYVDAGETRGGMLASIASSASLVTGLVK
jgi:hypothetical protein